MQGFCEAPTIPRAPPVIKMVFSVSVIRVSWNLRWGGGVGSGREAVAKHRQAALRFGLCHLVLQDVPVFGQAAVLDPDNVRGDPGDRPAGS